MTKLLKIHSKNPQHRLIKKVADELLSGGIIAYPTDSGYALSCILDNKNGAERIRNIRNLDKHHHFTLMMRNLAHIGEYAKLNNTAFRLLKKILPGTYTFILEGSSNIPARLLHAKRKTIGIRISNNSVVQALLAELSAPLMSVSLVIKNCEFYNIDDVYKSVNDKVDIVIDGGYCPPKPTTVIDLSNGYVDIIRQGSGDTSLIT